MGTSLGAYELNHDYATWPAPERVPSIFVKNVFTWCKSSAVIY